MLKFRKHPIEKRNFQASKERIGVNDDDIENIVVSNKYPVRKKKYFVNYANHYYDAIKPLRIDLLKLYGIIKGNVRYKVTFMLFVIYVI